MISPDVRPGAGAFDLGAIGAGLAFEGSLSTLRNALVSAGSPGAAVVQAPPGTGKTTLVPPLLANLYGQRGRVVVTQPRRVAARAAARRLSTLDGSRPAGCVGYTVRGERQAGPDTLIEFVTPGILLRRLLADPGLEGTSAIVLDEVHERGLETDLLLGMLAEVRALRGDLAVVAMSATLDAPRFAALLGEADGGGPAPVVDCPSVNHPLEMQWMPAPAPRLDARGVARAFLDHVAVTAADAHVHAVAADRSVDALVFLPGAREVSQVAASLRSRVGSQVDVLELHGQVGPAEQDRAVSGRGPGDPPRIIVSTDLAESSLTVPGVRLVIDSGLAREPRRDAGRGMSGLVTVSCSRASADQRAGRAARQGPGTVLRCYSPQAYGAAPAHVTPEINVADLTGHEWIAVADVTRAEGRDAAGTGAVIRAAAPISLGIAETAASHLLTDTVDAEFTGGRLSARRTRRLGSIVLSTTPVRPSAEQGRRSVAAALQSGGLAVLSWSTAAASFRRRLGFLHRELGAPWPAVSDVALLDRLEEWLGPELGDLAAGKPVTSVDLAHPLHRLLPWPEAGRLDELAPENLGVPSGSRVRIDYPEPGDDAAAPVVAVKLQECFGLAESPKLVGGRVPVLFHLLSPARRPLAVTDDLTSFWSGPYTQVRAEMRGRYPRHPWPEDPWSAPATARTKQSK